MEPVGPRQQQAWAQWSPAIAALDPGRRRRLNGPFTGRMAEWLCRGLQILVQRFDSASGLQPRTPQKADYLFSFWLVAACARATRCAKLIAAWGNRLDHEFARQTADPERCRPLQLSLGMGIRQSFGLFLTAVTRDPADGGGFIP